MKAIVGLGNPGRQYSGTRHNLGFEVIDELARRWRLPGFERETFGAEVVTGRPIGEDLVWLAKPTTFMNASGEAVSGLLRYYKIDVADLLVVVDETNLPLGRLRLRRSGSAGGHNGLKSVIQYVGPLFARLRIGVGRGDPRWDLADHVLSRFGPEEREAAGEAVGRAADAVETFIADGIEQAMNRFNVREDEGSEEEESR